MSMPPVQFLNLRVVAISRYRDQYHYSPVIVGFISSIMLKHSLSNASLIRSATAPPKRRAAA